MPLSRRALIEGIAAAGALYGLKEVGNVVARGSGRQNLTAPEVTPVAEEPRQGELMQFANGTKVYFWQKSGDNYFYRLRALPMIFGQATRDRLQSVRRFTEEKERQEFLEKAFSVSHEGKNYFLPSINLLSTDQITLDDQDQLPHRLSSQIETLGTEILYLLNQSPHLTRVGPKEIPVTMGKRETGNAVALPSQTELNSPVKVALELARGIGALAYQATDGRDAGKVAAEIVSNYWLLEEDHALILPNFFLYGSKVTPNADSHNLSGINSQKIYVQAPPQPIEYGGKASFGRSYPRESGLFDLYVQVGWLNTTS